MLIDLGIALILANIFQPCGCPARTTQAFGLRGPVASVRTEEAYVKLESGELKEWERFPVDLEVFDATGHETADILYKEDGTVDYKWGYVYGADGCQREANVYNPDGTPRNLSRFHYDSKLGMCIEEFSRQPGAPFRRTDAHFYDAHGKELAHYQYATDGSVSHKVIYTYDQAGRLGRQETHSVGRSPGLVRRLVYEHDEHGWVTRMTDYDGILGQVTGDFRYQFTFDDQGNWITRTESWLAETNGKSAYEPKVVLYRTITYR